MPLRGRARRGDGATASADGTVAGVSTAPALRLQRVIGNRATSRLLAREPAAAPHATVQIGKLSPITITGGNADGWAAKKDLDRLEVTSDKGRHSAELAKLSDDHTVVPSLKVTTPLVDQSGQYVGYGSVEIEFVNAKIKAYAADGKSESWTAADFEAVHRRTVSHRIGN